MGLNIRGKLETSFKYVPNGKYNCVVKWFKEIVKSQLGIEPKLYNCNLVPCLASAIVKPL